MQFSAYVYVADEEEGVAKLDVVRLGDQSKPSQVRWSTKDASGKAWETYEPASGTLSFEAGEGQRALVIKLIPTDRWSPVLDFAVELLEEGLENAKLGQYGVKTRIKVIDKDAFPCPEMQVITQMGGDSQESPQQARETRVTLRIECLAMGKRSRADRLEVAAAKASAGGGAQVHPSDVERHVPTGRSWLWSCFHLRQPPSKNVTQNVYYCSVCNPGKEGQADVASGIFRLSSVALNPQITELKRHQIHLKSAHGIEAESPLESKKQPTIDVHCRHHKAKNEKLLDGFAEHVLIQDMLPISACESPGLVQFMSTLDPKFKICSRKKMRFKVLPRVLHGLEEETWALLKEARADYSTVIHYAGDLCTAPGTGDAFMCHIFQFVTPAFELVTLCGGLVVLDESKTADHQRQEIARCFEMWDVPLSQQGCITTDHEVLQLSHEYQDYEKELTPKSRDMLTGAAMCDPQLKSLHWLPGADMDGKRKRNQAFLEQCYKIHGQLHDEPPDNTRVVSEIPYPNARQRRAIEERTSFFNRFQPPDTSQAASSNEAAAVRPIPDRSDQAVEKAWQKFKLDLKTQVYAYLVAPQPGYHDALKFWKEIGVVQYPLMAPVARYMLGVRASQATAERVFSSSGRRHRRLAFTAHSRAKTEACMAPLAWSVSETVTVVTPKKGERVRL
ncbi:unnamed protein product [Effrenium voratum]|uniref:Calx-beta domain-containing protein n=1 Tax=Effrenium voratum TaxID=2562239 RepID=A0AA36NFB2_9DINO|nr:unnamed protein product [Effrenium voratum]